MEVYNEAHRLASRSTVQAINDAALR